MTGIDVVGVQLDGALKGFPRVVEAPALPIEGPKIVVRLPVILVRLERSQISLFSVIEMTETCMPPQRDW